MHQDIQTAQKVVGEAKKLLAAVVAEVQATCEHQHVAELPRRSGRFLDTSARRICYDCGLEEEGSAGSGGKVWSRAEHGPSALANRDGRFVVPVDEREFYRLRVA